MPRRREIRETGAQFSSFVDVLRLRARTRQNQVAYHFLDDRGENQAVLTYGELDRRARAIAATIQSLGCRGQRALILHSPGPGFVTAFFACMYAGVVAVTTYPPHPSRFRHALPRLQSLLEDAQCMLVLGSTRLLTEWRAHLTGPLLRESVSLLATETIAEGEAKGWQDPQATRDTLAVLQYTSGSTGRPRGVLLTQGNLLHNSLLIQRGFQNSVSSRGLIWLPPYHDMGLIGGILQPVFVGFPVTLMSPFAFLQQPLRWLKAISDIGATASGGPNFAYELCVEKISPEQCAGLDLSTWEVAFNGAEPIRAGTISRFAAAFEPFGFRRAAFYPCYGLAEATLFVTGIDRGSPPAVCSFDGEALKRYEVLPCPQEEVKVTTHVGCGRSSPDQQVVIVDPETLKLCPPRRVGEIWVAGPSVGAGYWNRPEESARTFQAFLAETGEGPFLRTGDLGFFQDQELFVTGRIKDLVIINGRNHYPEDLELTAQNSHSSLRKARCAAFPVEVDGSEQLVIVQEVPRSSMKADVDEIRAAIRLALVQHHELQAYAIILLKPGQIPLTTSGKISRSSCQALYLQGKFDAFCAQFSPRVNFRVKHAVHD